MINSKSYLSIVCLLLIITAFSCSKENNRSDENTEKYLRCKINGEVRAFNYQVNANDKPDASEVHFVVIAGWEKQDMITSFGINMTVPGEGAKEITYTVAGGSTPELSGQYSIQNMKDGRIVSTTIYNGGRVSGTSFTLTITSLTQWGVKGTFSGKLKLSGGNAFITVTDGEFSAPYN